MRTIWNSSNYGNDIALTRNDANICYHSGDCHNDILEILKKKYVKKQVAKLDYQNLIKELSDYGAWDELELTMSHENNIVRWLWLSAADIVERN